MRHYRVAASCFEPDLTLPINDRRASLLSHLEALLQEQEPDLLVVPELALIPDMDELLDYGVEAVDGPTITAVSGLAARHNANVCMPILEEADKKMYNAAVFLDRKGKLAGKYYKHTPTQTELDLGILAGPAQPDPVIIDGLRVGTAICYDENYPDLLWNYMNKGVDLFVFPSYTFGGRLISTWALNAGVPLVCSFPWKSVIYDRDGSILADGGTWTTTVKFGNHPAWIAHSLNMQSRIYHLDYNQQKITDMLDRYGSGIDIKLLVEEARMQITVLSENLSIEQVEHEMVLMPLQAYLSATRSQADQMRTAVK